MVCDITAPADEIDEIEAKLLGFPQIDCPVVHHFGPGIYIREVRLPANSLILGHKHKTDHTNILISGKLRFLNEGGNVVELVGPCVLNSNAGRKIAYIVEDVIWQNVYATDERDIEKLDEAFVCKSNAWIEFNKNNLITKCLT
jgi:hypothetical protein